MAILLAGVVLFALIHLFPTLQSARSHLIAKLSENGYKGVFSLLSLGALVLIVIGTGRADAVTVYTPPPGLRPVTGALMLLSMTLLAAANMPTNIKRFTRHPMLWGVVCWSVSHLLANGNQADLALFGGFAVYSLLAMMSANWRGATKSDTRLPRSAEVKVVVAGAIAFGVFVVLHPYLFGVAVV